MIGIFSILFLGSPSLSEHIRAFPFSSFVIHLSRIIAASFDYVRFSSDDSTMMISYDFQPFPAFPIISQHFPAISRYLRHKVSHAEHVVTLGTYLDTVDLYLLTRAHFPNKDGTIWEMQKSCDSLWLLMAPWFSNIVNVSIKSGCQTMPDP